jgi:hypothetical protein
MSDDIKQAVIVLLVGWGAAALMFGIPVLIWAVKQ